MKIASLSSWGFIVSFIISTSNRVYVGWFGILMFPLLFLATLCFVTSFIFAPPVDIDGIREPVAGSLLYGNNIITGAVIPSSNAIGVHFYPIWESLGVCSYMGREWEFSFRIGMRPWIFIAFSAPVIAASAVFMYLLCIQLVKVHSVMVCHLVLVVHSILC
jgi:photosystem II P680 reaction center D1 protein